MAPSTPFCLVSTPHCYQFTACGVTTAVDPTAYLARVATNWGSRATDVCDVRCPPAGDVIEPTWDLSRHVAHDLRF